MPPTFSDEGVRLARELRADPEIGIVLLSQFTSPGSAVEFLEGGSRGRAYLLKENVGNRRQLVTAVMEVAGGGSVIDPTVVEALVGERARGERSALGELTPRELDVLAEVAQGKSNAAIAASLFLTKRAVEKHINSIFRKLGLPDDTDVSRRVVATLLFLAGKPSAEF